MTGGLVASNPSPYMGGDVGSILTFVLQYFEKVVMKKKKTIRQLFVCLVILVIP